MANSKILFDKTEIVLVVFGGKKPQVINLTYDKIVRIQFDKFEERKLFKKIPSEKITIAISGREQPVVYTMMKEKKFFEEYKRGLTKFAKDNRITFINNLVE